MASVAGTELMIRLTDAPDYQHGRPRSEMSFNFERRRKATIGLQYTSISFHASKVQGRNSCEKEQLSTSTAPRFRGIRRGKK